MKHRYREDKKEKPANKDKSNPSKELSKCCKHYNLPTNQDIDTDPIEICKDLEALDN